MECLWDIGLIGGIWAWYWVREWRAYVRYERWSARRWACARETYPVPWER